ncbi:probable protein S-acyltransferase 22 [Phalaenopsis equestris]|uniref:probable protein S-acyltransferase 22 n=1 Tax=Phalaenopsis equestris TaxID=78828 RepID=UPI0009E25057|nr:probable protein S-acyltransferase 22 [Phalaenopsis equestris]
MRKHGWQLPYHPLQVVAIAVFLALGFAFYVFFMPFVCRKVLEYVVMGIYTSLATSVFCLYVWCAATNPGDPGVFKSKKYLMAKGNRKSCNFKDCREEAQVVTTSNKLLDDEIKIEATGDNRSQGIEKKTSEDGMFYCCLCEVEVRRHSKHCRVCDKCVDHFDHHCRWLNNCIGRKNYWKFFVLMISAILLVSTIFYCINSNQLIMY